jgi:hypothetical protein
LLTLGYVAHLVRREGAPWWVALAASVLSATASWFFVSTGWLAYFDSWCVLGLLVAAFGRSKVATGLACLLTPWVDERFVLTLPLVVIVRGISTSASRAALLSEGLRFFAFVAPYCALRLFALFTAQDEGSASHLRGHLGDVRNARVIATGMWFGLRSLWAFVAVAPVLLIGKGRPVAAGFLAVAVAATMAVNVPVAHDLSRSASTLLPAAVLGMILLIRARPSLAGLVIVPAVAFNLLTPAEHVIAGWDETIPIYSLKIELRRWNRPPANMAALHLNRAAMLVKRGLKSKALPELEIALSVDPSSLNAHFNRGLLLTELGRTVEAEACYDTAVRLAPDQPEAYHKRARFHRVQGKLALAERDLRAAVDLSAAGSPSHVALSRELALVRSQLGRR